MDTNEQMIRKKKQPAAIEQPWRDLASSKRTDVLEKDLTGRDRLVSNVLFNWAAYSVFVISGFIMPRLIDRRLGQESLGVWDFAWSLVSYFQLVQAGIASSVNRYIARYRAASDDVGVNRVVSSATCVLGVAGLLVTGLTITFSTLLPQLFGSRLGENAGDAQWVVFFLGETIAIRIAFGAFNGVLTGCHRWGLHNANTSGWHVATVGGMIAALSFGGDLWVLAAITLAGETLSSARRVVLAHNACGCLRLRLSHVRWLTIRELFFFSGKTLVPTVSNLLLNQTTSVLILLYLGPAALALYTRPYSLTQHISALVNRMAMVLIPTVSSLQSAGRPKDIQELLLKSVRCSTYIALPMILVIVIFGDEVMRLWMGSRYADVTLPAVLAVGYLPAITQLCGLNLLMGLNAHGRVGLAVLAASLCSVALTIVVLALFNASLAGVAFAVVLPLAAVNSVYLPVVACRRVGITVGKYFVAVALWPVVHMLPFTGCLVLARVVFRAKPVLGLVWGGAAGGAVLIVFYWFYVLPNGIKTRMYPLVTNSTVGL